MYIFKINYKTISWKNMNTIIYSDSIENAIKEIENKYGKITVKSILRKEV